MNEDSAKKLLFREVRQDVAVLYDIYYDYTLTQKRKGEGFEVPSTFLLVSAFAGLFSDLKIVSGYTGFVVAIDQVQKKVEYDFKRHSWLTWRDEYHIIDLVPLDGGFELSSPQAVIQQRNAKRFISAKNIFPEDWSIERRVEFNNQVESLVEILQTLQKKVPL